MKLPHTLICSAILFGCVSSSHELGPAAPKSRENSAPNRASRAAAPTSLSRDERDGCCLPLEHIHTPDCLHAGHARMIAEQAGKLAAVLDDLEQRPGGGGVNRYPIGAFPRPAIHTAALIGRVDLARRVLALDPDPNALDMFGHTALDRINEGSGHGDITGMMSFLLSIGADCNVYR